MSVSNAWDEWQEKRNASAGTVVGRQLQAWQNIVVCE